MNLLAGKLYDPATAVNKVTTALLAMTALDTTNLRLSFTVPPSGMVRVRMSGTLHGATTMPQIMLGVLEGATVKGRQSPMHGGTNIAATSLVKAEADFIVTGLTPGAALNYDAAYGVETIVASTGLKYGGPNNTTANDNFGGFAFEIWDPAPNAAIADAVWDEAIAGHLTAGTTGEKLNAAGTLDAAGVRAAVGLASANLDTQLGTIAGYIDTEVAAILGHVDTEVGAIKLKTDNLPSDPARETTGAAVKAKTDSLNFTVAGKLDVNLLVVNGVTVGGAGTAGNPWGPV